MENENLYSIKAVSQMTGMSEFAIRAWEKRYSVVSPARTGTNRRLYSKTDVDRLSLLFKATKRGHSISNISSLTDEQLKELTGENFYSNKPTIVIKDQLNYEEYLLVARSAIKELEPDKFEQVLLSASINLSMIDLLQNVVIELIYDIGEKWEMGEFRVSNEHFASVILSKFLTNYRESFKVPGNEPKILISSPMGQYHEFGSLLISVVAASKGWKVIYFGPNLPVADIVSAANQLNVNAVSLSLVYPPADINLKTELEKLKFLNRNIILFAGGRAANTYTEVLTSLNTIILDDIFKFRDHLDIYFNKL